MVLRIFNRDKIFSPSQQIDEYTVIERIGEGRFGICYRVDDGRGQYILKQLKRGMLRKTGAKAVFEEEILMRLAHESIPRFIRRIEAEDFYGYVLEHKWGKTFEDIIYLENRAFVRKEIYGIGAQLVEIIKYLHAQGVVHRDIRVPNTLYDGEKVYLVDFGLARWINNKKYKADMDFAFLGDFLMHLLYTSFESQDKKKRPWYEELELTKEELHFFQRLMGVKERYTSIYEVENDFLSCMKVCG